MAKRIKRVGFICTGEELVIGDIQDSNSTFFAQQLTDHHIEAGQRVIVGDSQAEIEQAIRYLLENHDAIITIGGLGPTSDDRTRFALADALDSELVFYDEVWQWIVTLMTSKNLDIPDINRQQAQLPAGASAIRNHNGTAAACYIEHHGKDVFMLPGPPNECRPIFADTVLTALSAKNYNHRTYRQSWLLLGASESQIAAELQPLMVGSPCTLGYRVNYPYLEIKLWGDNDKDLQAQAAKLLPKIKSSLISTEKKTASQQFLHYLSASPLTLNIDDQATKGLLAATLTTPETHDKIRFTPSPADDKSVHVKITGLEDYWENKHNTKKHLSLSMIINNNAQEHTIDKTVRYRGYSTLTTSVEIICWQLLLSLQ